MGIPDDVYSEMAEEQIERIADRIAYQHYTFFDSLAQLTEEWPIIGNARLSAAVSKRFFDRVANSDTVGLSQWLSNNLSDSRAKLAINALVGQLTYDPEAADAWRDKLRNLDNPK